MTQFKKIALIAVFILLAGSFYLFFINPEPKELKLEGLKAEVTVLKDEFGIPHISAQNNHDMMFALGYTMASDRLFQMDLLRRVGSGRLSELFGKDLLDTDILLRRLTIKKTMSENWAKYKKTAPKEMLTEAQAFIDGLNAFIKQGQRPLEMKILRYRPDPFTFEDSLAVAGYLSLNFAESLDLDVMYSELLKKLPKNEVDLIFPRGSQDIKDPNLFALKTKAHNKNTNIIAPATKSYVTFIDSALSTLLTRLTLFHGSNAWLLSGSRTTSGKPILANDPHIGFSAPGLWYEAHIKSPTTENYGHYVPLVPFPGLAHNKNRAWGITMAKIDEMDLYQETFHPKNKNKVLFKNEYVDVIKYTEVIKVKGEKDVVIDVIKTPHGPIIDGTKYANDGAHLSLKWQFLSKENNPGLTFYLLSKTETVWDLEEAIKHATSPSFSISMADAEGNIGYHVMGRIPIRPKGVNGKTILDGAAGKHEYIGYLDVSENPHSYNPKSGVIVTANHKPNIKTKKNINGMWLSKDRYLRIHELLAKKDKWDLESLKKVQTDVTLYNYNERYKKVYELINPDNDFENSVKSKLLNWKGKTNKKSVEASIFNTFLAFVLQNTVSDELGKDWFKIYSKRGDPYNFLRSIFKHEKSKLWDNVNSDVKETMSEIINKSFKQTVKHLQKTYGKNISSWHWEKLHTLTFKHTLGKVFPLNHLFNLGPFPVTGGGNLINNFGGDKGSLIFNVDYGPSTRRLIDLKSTKKSYGILPLGNSGNRFSKHYQDQVDLFLKNKYREQTTNFETVKQDSSTRLLKLKP